MGGGCANCKRLLQMVNHTVEKLGIDAEVSYVTDFAEIAKSGVMRTPALFIDGKLLSSGPVPPLSEIEEMIAKANK